MLGIAGLLLVLGALYSRIGKITIAGNTVDLAAVPAAQQDAKAIGKAIGQRKSEQLRAAAREDGTIDQEEASPIVEQGAEAAAAAQLEAARLRLAAAAAVPTPRALTVDSDELNALGTGMPLPPSLLKR
jgi:hypothetical protein